MRVIYDTLPSERITCVVSLGVFDGVHRGHQLIIKRLKSAAARRKVSPCLITFDKLPEEVLHTSSNYHRISSAKVPGHLTDMREKACLIESLGVGHVWFLKTSPLLMHLSAQQFIRFILRHLDVKVFVVGEDFRFGSRGGGNLDFLRNAGKKHGFTVEVVKKLKIKKGVVSSSAIRAAIENSDFKKAREYLGRQYSLSARVAKGKGLGRELGFPTANLFSGRKVVPGEGVYAARVHANGKEYISAVNIAGAGNSKLVEAHLIGFEGKLLDKAITVVFLEKIRNEKKFFSRSALIAAIAADVKYIYRKYSRYC